MPESWKATIRRDALEMYEARADLSERTIAKRAYPELTEGAAQMRLRRRKGRGRVDVPGEEAKAIGRALGVPFHWLSSDVRWRLSGFKSRPVVVGGAVYLFDQEGEAAAAAHLLERSGFLAGARAQAVTTREAQDESTKLGAPPLMNVESATDSALDDFEILLDIERRLRGQPAEAAGLWLDGWAWPGWTEHLPRYVIALRHEMREADAARAVELSTRANAVCDLLDERVRALRPASPPPAPRTSREW